MARGNTFLKLDGGDWDCVVYALKKFTGGMGDDDDRSGGGDKHVWKQYFTKVNTKFNNGMAHSKSGTSVRRFIHPTESNIYISSE